MSDLRDRIAAALYQHDPTSRTEGMSAHVRHLAREAANARADAVMGVVGPEIAERDAALALVRDLADDEPCRHDHHGYCQEHGWMATEPPCPHGRARQLAGEDR